MRGVLVDDDDAVAGLGDDIGFVHLRARRAERRGEVGSRAAGAALGARVGGERDAKRGCAGSGEAGRRRRSARRARRASPSWPRRGAGAPLRRARSAASVAVAARGRGAMQRRLERLLQRADDQAAHEAGVAEPHLRLGRMDVDVDIARVAFDEQRRDAPCRSRGQIIEIGRAQGARRSACRAPPGR